MAKQKKEIEDKTKAKEKELKRLVAERKGFVSRTFATADGIKTLRLIMEECGQLDWNVVFQSGTRNVDCQSTSFNESRRSLYLMLRRYVSRETTIAVEIDNGMMTDNSDEMFG